MRASEGGGSMRLRAPSRLSTQSPYYILVLSTNCGTRCLTLLGILLRSVPMIPICPKLHRGETPFTLIYSVREIFISDRYILVLTSVLT